MAVPSIIALESWILDGFELILSICSRRQFDISLQHTGLFTADDNLSIQALLDEFGDLTAFTPLTDSGAATGYICQALSES